LKDYRYGKYHEEQDIYYASELLKWEIKGTDAEGTEIIQAHKRMYLHLYYDDQRALDARRTQHKKVLELKRELEQGEQKTAHEQLYAKYFTIKKTPKRGMSVTIRTEVLEEEAKYYGYFSLMSNLVKDPIDALIVYRAKDVVEKAFGNLKERLALRRPGVSTHANLQGKIFVQYIALIILSQLQRTMREQKLYQSYTIYTLLDELDVIEYFTHAGKRGHWGEVTKKQAKLFQAFEVPSPVHIK
jgi:transposase